MTDRIAFAPASAAATGPSVKTRGRWTLSGILSVFRQRHRLARLDDHMLADLGISRADAEAEAARPIWDVPARGRR